MARVEGGRGFRSSGYPGILKKRKTQQKSNRPDPSEVLDMLFLSRRKIPGYPAAFGRESSAFDSGK
jgi:hypothetical protein